MLDKTKTIPAAAAATPDYAAVKQRQQATWGAGDYAVIGTTLQIVGERLCEAVDLRAGERVLDVAAGNGNASLAAARRGCDVVATDYVTDLLDGAQRRAAANGLAITTQFADAENLPFDDRSFDAILSPVRHTRASSLAAFSWLGVNITPKVDSTTSKEPWA